MDRQVIEAKGNSLEEARAWVLHKIPAGMDWLSEEVVSDGNPQFKEFSGTTVEEAFTVGESELPDGAQIQNKQVIKEPSVKKVNVTAKNETEARRIYNDSTIKSLRCIKEGKKGFLGLGSPSSEYELEIQEPAVVKITFVTPILIKVTVGSVRNEILIMSEGLAGGWPPELSRETFKTIDLDALVAELKRYQEMPHPQDPVMALTAELLGATGSNMPPNRPNYEMIDNKIARRSWPMEDAMLLTTAEYLKGRGDFSPTDNETIVSWAMELIQHYAGTKLAKFLFNLPRIDEMIKSGANQMLIIVEYYSIDCYKGIENILFEIYAELGQGQTFSDKTVTDKLVSLVNKIANG